MTTLKTILYFSIFNYPVTKGEIFKFSSSNDLKVIEQEIDILLSRKIIFKIKGFYLKVNSFDLVQRRMEANKRANSIMPKALKVSKLIGKFPYVKGVALSGGLSKGIFHEDDDVDFFIVTAANRLWIARTFLILYKKIFLLNSKKYFCINYFKGIDDLEITEKNKFTAMEIATLIPTRGEKVFQEFIRLNQWVKYYFPNKGFEENFKFVKNIQKPMITKLIEGLLENKFGNILDDFLRSITLYRWRSKFKFLPEKDFKVAMKSTKNVSKHHPQNFQKKVIESLNEHYFKVQEKHKITLEPEHA
ncbi:nucleotidyltransferase domain-containing protein [Geojedonia litorea]|uniref:Nucleotidyltransferase domain-containing protein n=1 Tax=Geojedonia litorea TaxID=1268269 RepID=A0ABV9MZ60_9FLAO